MSDWTVRLLNSSDEAELLRLWQEVFIHEPVSAELLREKVWGDPGFDADLTSVVTDSAGQVVGMGMAVVRETSTYHRGYIKVLAVAPQARRQGIGRMLLHQLEGKLLERGVQEIRIAESAPNYLTPGLDVRYTPGMLLLEAESYTRIGETYNLDVDLEQAFSTIDQEAQLAECGIAVRRAEVADAPAAAAFLAAYWPTWQAEVDVAFMQAPIALHVALRGAEVLGFSAYDTNNIGTGWFGPMGTAPAARGLGIGGVLLKRCLRDLQAQGLKRAIIPWVGPIRFYANTVCATIDRVFYRYAKTLAQ